MTHEARTDAGHRVLVDRVDELRRELQSLGRRLDETSELTKELRRLVQALEKWSEGQNVHTKHAVTYQGLLAAVLTVSLAICGVCWKFVENAQTKMEQARREISAETSARIAELERRIDEVSQRKAAHP